MEKNLKTLSPKLDVVFQAIFGEVGNEKITKGFLETIDLSKNLVLRRELKDEKLGILDILAELDGKEKCNIELQILDRKNIIERILFYWSKLYSRDLKAGQDYKELEKTIIILIINFELEGLEELSYHSKWQIMETGNSKKIILTEKLEIDIIELPKIIGCKTNNDKLLDWLYFLEEPRGERVTKKMEENEELKEAVEKLCTLSEDEKMQRIADLREKAILDEKAIYAKGIDVGIKEGIKNGKKQKQIEIARVMLKNKEELETIIKYTGLTKNEIKQLM